MSPLNSQNPFSNLSLVVKNLLMINIVFFLATYVLGKAGFDLETWLAAYYPASPLFKPWQIITYMFMHGSIGHIFSNMLGLIFIGPLLEYTLGSKRFLQYYMITGIGALVLQYLVQAFEVHAITGSFGLSSVSAVNDLDVEKLRDIFSVGIVGASGAIFGLLVAVYLLFPEMQVYIYFLFPVKIKYLVPIYVLWELYSGFSPTQGDSVAHFAHIGGALVGFILIKIWGIKKPDNFFS